MCVGGGIYANSTVPYRTVRNYRGVPKRLFKNIFLMMNIKCTRERNGDSEADTFIGGFVEECRQIGEDLKVNNCR